jgi:hypothetical protein
MARLVRKDLKVPLARMELTERLARKVLLVRSVLKVPLAQTELTERRDLWALKVT